MLIDILLAFTLAALLAVVLNAACKPKEYPVQELERKYNAW